MSKLRPEGTLIPTHWGEWPGFDQKAPEPPPGTDLEALRAALEAARPGLEGHAEACNACGRLCLRYDMVEVDGGNSCGGCWDERHICRECADDRDDLNEECHDCGREVGYGSYPLRLPGGSRAHVCSSCEWDRTHRGDA